MSNTAVKEVSHVAKFDGSNSNLQNMWNTIETEYAENAAENEHLFIAKLFNLKHQPGLKCEKSLTNLAAFLMPFFIYFRKKYNAIHFHRRTNGLAAQGITIISTTVNVKNYNKSASKLPTLHICVGLCTVIRKDDEPAKNKERIKRNEQNNQLHQTAQLSWLVVKFFSCS